MLSRFMLVMKRLFTVVLRAVVMVCAIVPAWWQVGDEAGSQANEIEFDPAPDCAVFGI